MRASWTPRLTTSLCRRSASVAGELQQYNIDGPHCFQLLLLMSLLLLVVYHTHGGSTVHVCHQHALVQATIRRFSVSSTGHVSTTSSFLSRTSTALFEIVGMLTSRPREKGLLA